MNFLEEKLPKKIADLKEDPNTVWCWDFADGREQWLGTGFFATLYFMGGTARQGRDKAHLVVDCIERFHALTGHAFKTAMHPKSSAPHSYGSKRLPQDWHAFTDTYSGNNINFNFSSEKSLLDSPEFALSSNIRLRDDFENYNFVRFDFTLTWWREHKSQFKLFWLETAQKLNAEQGYMGFGFARPLDLGASADVEGLEYQLAQHFYGLDIEQPFWQRNSADGVQSLFLGGMRPPVWGTLVGGQYLQKMGGAWALTQALQQGGYPEVSCQTLRCDATQEQVWIEVGSEPHLYPVTAPVPPALRFVAKVLEPIRGKQLSLTGMGRWDDDTDLVFTMRQSKRWLARFDEEGDWPSLDVRVTASQPVASTTHTLSALPGSLCTKAGTWTTTALLETRQITLQVGETFPAVTQDKSGNSVIWYWTS